MLRLGRPKQTRGNATKKVTIGGAYSELIPTHTGSLYNSHHELGQLEKLGLLTTRTHGTGGLVLIGKSSVNQP